MRKKNLKQAKAEDHANICVIKKIKKGLERKRKMCGHWKRVDDVLIIVIDYVAKSAKKNRPF